MGIGNLTTEMDLNDIAATMWPQSAILAADSANLTLRGTHGYVTPSWYVGGHPDMYGAAATLYSLLTGNHPDRMARRPRGGGSLPPLDDLFARDLMRVPDLLSRPPARRERRYLGPGVARDVGRGARLGRHGLPGLRATGRLPRARTRTRLGFVTRHATSSPDPA